jgi:hypothetical protein
MDGSIREKAEEPCMKRLIAAGSLLFGFGVTPLHAAEEVISSDRIKSCRKEVWRVYAPSNAPKGSWMMRPEKRTVVVCSWRVLAVSGDPVSGDHPEGEER